MSRLPARIVYLVMCAPICLSIRFDVTSQNDTREGGVGLDVVPKAEAAHAVNASSRPKMVGREGAPRARTVPGNPVQIPIEFITCRPNESAAWPSDEQLDKQIIRLNDAFGGTQPCDQHLWYTPEHADMMMRFVSRGRKDITNGLCGTQCASTAELWQEIINSEDVLTPEHGVLKVLVCEMNPGNSVASGRPQAGVSHLQSDENASYIAISQHVLPGGQLKVYNTGNILVFYVAATFNLKHTAGDAGVWTCDPNRGDDVNDTNNELRGYIYRVTAESRPASCDSVDPIHNYMDFTLGDGMCTFTPGQRDRMWDYIETKFPSLRNGATITTTFYLEKDGAYGVGANIFALLSLVGLAGLVQ